MKNNRAVRNKLFGLFCLFSFLFLTSLGCWQVYRLNYKNNLIEKISNRISSKPSEYGTISSADFNDIQYRLVNVEGTFDHKNEIRLYTGPREFKGDPGYNIFTPLITKDYGVVLVDRGWVNQKDIKQEDRPDTLVPGVVKLTGMVMSYEKKSIFTPDNDTSRNLWFYIDKGQIEKTTSYELPPFYIRMVAGDIKDIYPVPGDVTVNIRNDHLQYAITWYGLAIIVIVIYATWKRKNPLVIEK